MPVLEELGADRRCGPQGPSDKPPSGRVFPPCCRVCSPCNHVLLAVESRLLAVQSRLPPVQSRFSAVQSRSRAVQSRLPSVRSRFSCENRVYPACCRVSQPENVFTTGHGWGRTFACRSFPDHSGVTRVGSDRRSFGRPDHSRASFSLVTTYSSDSIHGLERVRIREAGKRRVCNNLVAIGAENAAMRTAYS
jgi:hypothetical protein